MDMKILVAIIVAAGLIAGLALLAGHSSGTSGEETGESPTPPPTTTPPGQGGGLSLEGVWSGTYTSSRGSGGWTWQIKKLSNGEYTGCIRVTGPYDTGGMWMPLQINVNGDSITLGMVGGPGVTFSGQLNGASASGSWSMMGGQDSGAWSGSRTGPLTGDLPCQAGSGTPGGGYTTTTSPPPGSTTGGGSAQPCTIQPPNSLSDSFDSAYTALVSVFGRNNLSCMQSILSGDRYVAVFSAPASQEDIGEIAGQLGNALAAEGWSNVSYVSGSSPSGVAMMAYRGNVILEIAVTPSSSTRLMIALSFSTGS